MVLWGTIMNTIIKLSVLYKQKEFPDQLNSYQLLKKNLYHGISYIRNCIFISQF